MLFDLFNGPVVELVDIKSSQVVFRSLKPLECGRPLSVRLSTGNGRAVPVKVSITGSRPLGKGFACSAQLEEALAIPEFANQRLAGGDPFLRQSTRLDCRLRVLSPALPGFKAVSLDFSTGGLQVEAQGAIGVGQEIKVYLEFDALEPLECQARVAWCAPRGHSRVAMGLQFVHLSPQSRAQLERYEKYLLTRDDSGADADFNGNSLAAEPPCGKVLSYAVEAEQATVIFRTSQGPTLRMRFDGYEGLSDRGRAVGRDIQSLRDLPAQGCTRYQFLDSREQIVLEVLASDCTSEI